MTYPVSHLEEALKLEGEAIVHLYQVTLKKTGSIIRFWNGPTTTWQGQTYSYWPCQQSKDTETSDDQTPRPTLTVHNPNGILTPLAGQGEFDLALVIRKDLRQDHLLGNVNISKQRVWFISRPLSMNREVVSFELRSTIDFPNFQIPPRQFNPPEFPFLVY